MEGANIETNMNRTDCHPSRSTFTDRWLQRALAPRPATVREALEEKDNAFILRLDLPGFRKEELKIEVKNQVLVLTATAAEERPFVVSGSRSWKLGPALDTEAITARLENGVLELTLPKRATETVEPRNIDIQ